MMRHVRAFCQRRWSGRAVGVVSLAGVLGACFDPSPPSYTGVLGGQVVVSGPLRGATITIDQLDRVTGEVLFHIGDAVTDGDGRFGGIETHNNNGIFRIRAWGGRYRDVATGSEIELDATDELRSLLRFPLLGLREDSLVSPIGHLVEARAMALRDVLGDMTAAMAMATGHLHPHFGNVEWGLVPLARLDQPQISPTEPVRAAFLHAALSVLASDIANDAQAGPQEVNVYRLMQRWADDIRTGGFDGNDLNDRAPGSGLQVGLCPPVEADCVVPAAGCTSGSCRRLCDLYAGTARTLFAGAVAKVIRDSGPGGLNQTGLDLPNLVSVVRNISDNPDAELFGRECVETLDRLAPSLRFDAPTPGEGSFVRGAVPVRVTAIDDTDPKPRASIVGFVDADGDPTNAVAQAVIDTTALTDGGLSVTARARDLAGNVVSVRRTLAVDNTAPGLELSPTGYWVDGATWWTAATAPTLQGSIADASPVSVKAIIPGRGEVAALVSGSLWTLTFPAGTLDATGTTIAIVATDAAGNQTTIAQRLRPDLEPPALSFQPSVVLTEAAELVTFAADHAPQHVHSGAPVDLTAAGVCPAVTKFSYLLRSTGPAYATESPGPNPIRYQLIAADPGVGIAPGATQYRVGRRVGSSTAWILDWTTAGAGVPVTQGATRFPLGIYADRVAGLAATEGIYDVQFRATDRLARTTTAARCFDLKLRAPPLELKLHGASPTEVHAYALDSLSLAPGAPHDQIAARLLNDQATGASLIDQDVWNGTTETVYLTVTVTQPGIVTAAQSYRIDNAATGVAPVICDPICPDPPSAVPGPTHFSLTTTTVDPGILFPAKVFEVIGGVPVVEVPCVAPCAPSGSAFRFAIPPRVVGQPARMFRVMTMIGRVPGLWPQSPAYPMVPPFADDQITWTDLSSNVTTTTRLTGFVDRTPVAARTGCVRWDLLPDGTLECKRTGTWVPYRALRSASLSFSSKTETTYSVSVTATSAPVHVGERSRDRLLGWSTSEGALPATF
jgi:hypothetical protein